MTFKVLVRGVHPVGGSRYQSQSLGGIYYWNVFDPFAETFYEACERALAKGVFVEAEQVLENWKLDTRLWFPPASILQIEEVPA